MSKDIDQKIVDQKIHRFLARKSPLRTLSETIAYRLGLSQPRQHRRVGLTYERI